MTRALRKRGSMVVHLDRGDAATVCGTSTLGMVELDEHDTAEGLRPCVGCDRMKHAATSLRNGAPLPGLFGGGFVNHGARS